MWYLRDQGNVTCAVVSLAKKCTPSQRLIPQADRQPNAGQRTLHSENPQNKKPPVGLPSVTTHDLLAMHYLCFCILCLAVNWRHLPAIANHWASWKNLVMALIPKLPTKKPGI